MASLNDYAKLSYHKTDDTATQFRPDESVTFVMKYSESLTGKYATLIVYGYEQDEISGQQRYYNGLKLTQQLTSGMGGQWYEEFIIPPDALGFTPTGSSYRFSGKMQAKVEVGSELDYESFEPNPHLPDQGIPAYVTNPDITSNIILVDMLVINSNAIHWIDPITGVQVSQYNTDSSHMTVDMYISGSHNYGISDNDNVQSYRVWLYDSYKNLLRDSNEMYDWDSNVSANKKYTFYDLQDQQTYYARGRITLNGGYTFNYDYIPIYTDFSGLHPASPNFTIEQQIGKVLLTLDLTGISHTKIIVTRTVQYEGEYLEIQNVIDDGDTVKIEDRYPIPGEKYEYKAVVFNGELIVGTYYNNISYTSNCIAISDIFACYTAIGNITKHPISRNDRGQIVETIDSKMPYHIMNGKADYDSGTVDALFSEVEDCQIVTENGDVANALRAWLNNGRAKLLTYYNGEAWIVSTSSIQTTDPANNDVYNTTFKWTQIGDAFRINEYVRLGLVI